MASGNNFGKALIATGQKLKPTAGGAMRKVLEVAIDGAAGVPSAKEAASSHLGKKSDRDQAIDALVTQHIALAGAQGFATNLGGLVTMAVTLPANLAGVAVIQCRMVAAIAHLRGYDLDDNRVRSAILMCLLGESSATELITAGDLPSTPMAIATAPVFDRDLDLTVSNHVLGQLLQQLGGKRIGVLLARRIPVVGGGVGAATDGWATFQVASYARAEFVDRRHRAQ
ncbi:EcsC family protein [Propionibacteriaceae bacterium Y1923]|uniref:EcsC family protein n=1 Tax=Aestuariimicrobium sp. Y1814 TaxID=3418742 RepID=UPI003C182DCA